MHSQIKTIDFFRQQHLQKLIQIIITLMNKIFTTLPLSKQKKIEQKGYKTTQNYLKNEPDLYVIFFNKIYLLHKYFLTHSQYISRQIVDQQKVMILKQQFSCQLFEEVLNFLYGCKLNFQQNRNNDKLFSIARKLQIASLQNALVSDFNQNFQQYSFFKLYQISIKYGLKELLQRCQQQLQALQFQHINFNRSDMLSLPKYLFQSLIKNHQQLKGNKTIVGLTNNQIRDAIQAYSQHNNCCISTDGLMEVKYDCFESVNKNLERKQKILKLQRSFNKSLRKIFNSHTYYKSCTQPSQILNSPLAQEVLSLRNINENIQKGSQQMFDQIKLLKDQIKQSQNQQLNLQQIEQRIKYYQKLFNSDAFINQQKKIGLKPQINQIKDKQQNDKNSLISSCDYIQMSIQQFETVEDLKSIGLSIQTTNPSQSINQSTFHRIPQIDKDFTI